VAARMNLSPPFTTGTVLASGVLVFPTVMADSVMYVFVSDSDKDMSVNIRDQATGVPIVFSLWAQHAALAVIGKKEKKVVAKYGF
jgi:hypothetical protein